MFRIFLIKLILFSWTAPALADVFKIEDNILYYDTENSDITNEVSEGHEKELLTILKEHNEIDTLILNSGGGLVYVANEMADLVVTSREVVWLFLEQLRFEFVPGFHGLQVRFAA